MYENSNSFVYIRYAKFKQIKIGRTYVSDLLNLVSPWGAPMVGEDGKNLKICHSRLPEKLKMSLKNLSTMTNIFDKSHDVVLKFHEDQKQI